MRFCRCIRLGGEWSFMRVIVNKKQGDSSSRRKGKKSFDCTTIKGRGLNCKDESNGREKKWCRIDVAQCRNLRTWAAVLAQQPLRFQSNSSGGFDTPSYPPCWFLRGFLHPMRFSRAGSSAMVRWYLGTVACNPLSHLIS